MWQVPEGTPQIFNMYEIIIFLFDDLKVMSISISAKVVLFVGEVQETIQLVAF